MTEKLNKRNVCARWVPHELSEQQKKNRVECGNELIEHFSGRAAAKKIIVTDEKWIYCRDVAPKEMLDFGLMQLGIDQTLQEEPSLTKSSCG